MAPPPDLAERLGKISVGLRPDLVVTRHEMRHQVNYVFHDPTAFQNHAFNLEEYRVMTSILDDRTLNDVFAGLVERGVLGPEDRDEFFGFVLALHGKALLQLPINDSGKLYERYHRKRSARRKALLLAPMYFKIPLWDPDRTLDRTYRFVRHLFTRWGVLGCALLWLFVAWNLIGRFGEMFGEAARLLDPGNVPLLYVAIVVLKILHEFGHGYLCKKYGGEVPEMGVAFILCTPCAYVDASASWKFDNRWQRIAVGMGGMYVEAMIAAVFALIWVGTAPGFAHDLALNVVILSTVTTVLFNLNPLMRFDGYYVFADLMGTANLRERSTRFLNAWASRALLRMGPGPSAAHGERWLLGSYGVASALYKVSLAFGITAMVLLQWPLVGLLMGMVFGVLLIIAPVWKVLRWLWSDDATQPVRRRARCTAVAAVCVLLPLTLQIPVSWNVVADGILEAEHRQVLRAPTRGLVTEVLARNGDEIDRHRTVIVMASEAVALELKLATEQLAAEQLQRDAFRHIDPARSAYHAANLEYLAKHADSLRVRNEELSIVAPVGGTLVDDDPESLRGTFVLEGDPLAEVHGGALRLHALLPAEEAHRAAIHPGSVARVAWVAAPHRRTNAVVLEVRPVASREDIPAALTMAAGGGIYTAADGSGTDAAETPFVHVYFEPDWVPERCRANLTARVRFAGDRRSFGRWLRDTALGFYTAWKMS